MNLFELFAKISLDSTGFESALNAAKNALTAATTAVTAFSAASVKVGQEFDKSMSQVAATMGYTTEELNDSTSEAAKNFKKLRDFAQEMGAKTAFSASEAADALNYMALAGYDAETSMKMLPNVLNLAASGGIELARASDMITDAQSALGLNLKQTNTLVDQMAKTASKSNTSVAQLGDAILTIGGTADIMAGGTNHLNTVLGILADNGIKGSEAGTHLRNMILKLSAPTEDGAEAMEALGLSVFNAEGKMRSFDDIFGDLNKAMSTLTDEQKVNYISKLFNSRDIAAVNALLNTTESRWEELGLAINQSVGASQAMADTQLDNLAGDVTIFKSALEGAQIVLSDQLTPGIRDFVKFGTKSISNLSKAFKDGGLSGAMASLGDSLSEGLSMVLEDLPSLVDAGASLLLSLSSGIVENIPLLAESVLQIVQMLASKFVENWPVFNQTLVDVISQIALLLSNPETLTSLFESVISIIQTLADTLLGNYSVFLDVLIVVMNNIATFVLENIQTFVDVTMQIIDKVVGFILDNLPTFLNAAVSIIMSLVEGFTQALPDLLNYLPTIIDSITATLLTMLPLLVDTGVQLLTALITNLPTIINTIVEKMPEIIDSIVNSLMDMIPTIVDTGVRLLTALVDNLPLILQTLVTATQLIIERIVNGLKDLLPMLVQTGVDLFVALIKNLPQAIVLIVQALPDIISAIVGGLGEFLPSLWQAGKDLIAGLWNGISDAKEWLREKISGFFGGVVDSIKAFFGIKSPSKLFAGIGEMLDRGLAKGVGDYADLAVDAAEDMANDVFDATDRDYDFTATGNVDDATSAWRKNAPVINVYGAEGQDVNELAEIISERMAFTYSQEQAVWA